MVTNTDKSEGKKELAVIPTENEVDNISSGTKSQDLKELSEKIDSFTETKSKNIENIGDIRSLIDTQIGKQSAILSKRVQEGVVDDLKVYTDIKIKETDEKIKELVAQIKNTEENAKEVKKELENKIDNSKLGVIETMGIFVALFTFISVNINIFRQTKNLFTASAFMVLMAVIILLFISPLLLLMQKNQANGKFRLLMTIFAISFILLLAILFITKYINLPLSFE